MNISLIRHAETLGNTKKQYIGSTDSPLCEAGIARCKTLTPNPDVQLVYTSTLKRTVQTAEILYPKATIRRCDGLSEMDFGLFEGRNYKDMAEEIAYRLWVDSGCLSPCPGGEDRESFISRCTRAFLEILQGQAGQDCLYFVGHGGVIMSILSELAQPEREYFDWHTDFCSGYLAEYRPESNRPLRLLRPLNN